MDSFCFINRSLADTIDSLYSKFRYLACMVGYSSYMSLSLYNKNLYKQTFHIIFNLSHVSIEEW
jgi:hypothetical protein